MSDCLPNIDPFDWPSTLHWDATPGRTLQSSQFLRYYDVAPKMPTPAQVSRALADVATHFDATAFDSLVAAANDHTGTFNRAAGSAVRIWGSAGSDSSTPAPPIFKLLNRSLIHDSDDLQHWCTFIRALNWYLVNEKNAPKRDIVCYSGSKMLDAQASGLTVGRVLGPCMFFAMSTGRNVAEMFTGEAG